MNGLKKKCIYLLLLSVLFSACKEDETVTGGLLEEEVSALSDAADLEAYVVSSWTDLYLSLEQYSSGRPNAAARGIAYIYLAAYEVMVPSMEGYQSLDDEYRGLRIDQDLSEGVDHHLALNETFSVVLDHFLLNLDASYTAEIETLRAQLESDLSIDLTEEVTANSIIWGQHVANEVIEFSQTDDDAEEQILDPQPTSYEPEEGDGYWTYSAEEERALYPYWESARTFVASTRETTTVEPVAYSEAARTDYFDQMLEVYEMNNAAKQGDDELLWIAEFWSDDVEGLMISPPARQVSIANQLISQFDLSLEETVVMMIKLGFSLNDAAVSTWKYKYEHMVMRPNVFIHEFIDPDFQTNLYRLVYWPNPSFPGYPSGHSAFASAAAGIFIDTFGDNVTFTDATHEGRTEFLGEPRTWSTLSEMAAENAYSRIPLGVHIRMDCDEGLRLGYEVSDIVLDELDLRGRRAL